MRSQRLDGKVAIITGAAAGIGRATAIRLAAAGAQVVTWDRDDREAEALLAAIDQAAAAATEQAESDRAGQKAVFARVDVTDEKTIRNAVAETVDNHGGIDILINNAGITRDAQLVKHRDGEIVGEMSDEAWDAVIDVNLKGVFRVTRAVVPAMIASGGGAIVSASSVVGLYGNFGQTNYTASKAGVIAMTQTWARELGRHGIRVNAVAPGFVATDMAMAIPEKIRQQMAKAAPLGSLGTPEDIAEAYAWLVSDAASFVTGATLSVDGGLVIGT